jgi:MFS family permease
MAEAGEGVLAPLRVADFRRLWVGQTVSIFGDKINQVAMAFMVFKITGSALQMGVMLGIVTLPSAVLGLFGGALVDRWDRRRVMIGADIVRAVLVAAIPLALLWGIYAAYGIALLVAIASVFFEPAKLSLLPELVSEDSLLAANSLDDASVGIAELIGLALAGLVVVTIGYMGAFWLDAGSYLFSAACILLIAYRCAPPVRAGGDFAGSVMCEIKEGLGYIASHAILRELIALSGIALMATAATTTIFYQLVLVRFKGGAPGLAFLEASIIIGSLTGSFLVARTENKHNGVKLIGGLLVFAPLWMAVAFANDMIAAAVLLGLVGVANIWYYAPAMTLIQSSSAPEYRGRVMGARAMVVRSLAVVGLIGAGVIVQHWGLNAAIFMTGGIVGVSGVVALLIPAVRNA